MITFIGLTSVVFAGIIFIALCSPDFSQQAHPAHLCAIALFLIAAILAFK